MNNGFSRRQSLDSLRKEAKRWLGALQARDDSAAARAAHERLAKVLSPAPATPTLRDVQHALARENGFDGWTALKEALSPSAAASAQALDLYEQKAQALLDAYRLGTAEALERHYTFTWHRRPWTGLRSYIQLDLGKRPAREGGDMDITPEDARYLIAIEHGFGSWAELAAFAARIPSGLPMTATPVGVSEAVGKRTRSILSSRHWGSVLRALAEHPGATLEPNGQINDEMLEQISRITHITSLDLGNSKAVTDAGIRHLARMPQLRELDLSQTGVTDAGLRVLRELPALESLSLVMTAVTDTGLESISHGHALQKLNVMWTRTGDGAIRLLAGKSKFTHLWSGNYVTNAGLALLHALPAFTQWRGGEARFALLGNDSKPNQLVLRGAFTDSGMEHLRALEGLFSLDLADSALPISARGLAPLTALPHLAALSVDAKDDWMPHIANMRALRFLSAQDTTATDSGWETLSQSASIEYIWGRRSHGLGTRGFKSLGQMPKLRGLSLSCLHVDDTGIATLPQFPALRELMPMDIPDAGYRHIGQCDNLEALLLMYCRDTTDAATEHITRLSRLTRYFNSYTTITDRTPELLSSMDSLEHITFDACPNITNEGIIKLARLPRLTELRVSGNRLTGELAAAFPEAVSVHYAR